MEALDLVHLALLTDAKIGVESPLSAPMNGSETSVSSVESDSPSSHDSEASQ